MERFLRWARGLLGMAAIWGGSAALLGAVILGVISVVFGMPIIQTVVAAIGIFGAFGLLSGAAFGVALSLLVRDGRDRIPVIPMTILGLITAATGTFLAVLLTSTGPGTLWSLVQQLSPLLLGAGLTGSVFAAGITSLSNRGPTLSLAQSDELPQLQTGETGGPGGVF